MQPIGLTEAGTYKCPHCGALYALQIKHLMSSKTHRADCGVCREITTNWHSTRSLEHKLLRVPSAVGA